MRSCFDARSSAFRRPTGATSIDGGSPTVLLGSPEAVRGARQEHPGALAIGLIDEDAAPPQDLDAVLRLPLRASVLNAVVGPDKSLRSLRRREREVVAMVGRGLSNDEIADALYLSPLTVKTHVSRAMTKLHARDRAQLVVLAFRSGLTRLDDLE